MPLPPTKEPPVSLCALRNCESFSKQPRFPHGRERVGSAPSHSSAEPFIKPPGKLSHVPALLTDPTKPPGNESR